MFVYDPFHMWKIILPSILKRLAKSPILPGPNTLFHILSSFFITFTFFLSFIKSFKSKDSSKILLLL